MSKIIAICGPDRCGKETQTAALRDYFLSIGKTCQTVEVPIKACFTYPIIYWMLRNGMAKSFPNFFQVLQFLNRKIFEIFFLSRLEKKNDIIIFDRWSLSMLVYGEAGGASSNFSKFLAGLIRNPDHTIILLGNSFPHEAEDVYEADKKLQESVKIGYFSWSVKNIDKCSLVSANQEKEQVTNRILESLRVKSII